MNNEVRLGIIGSVDSGKCFAKDTKIKLLNGSTKLVQNITLSDILLGDDFQGRFILELSRGKSIMYKVKQTNGIDYIVNENHILSLYSNTDKSIVNISVKSYLKMNDNSLKGIRVFKDNTRILSDIEIEELPIDNYYGFSITDNHRFLLEDNTVTHNSTITGVLTKDILDDGRGKARSLILKHPHEKDSGRTSSISQHFIRNIKNDKTEKIVNFVDLAGHEKYLKTTITGLSKCLIDYTGIVVAANMGVLCMTKEHINIVMALNIPSFIILTKVDISPEHIKNETLKKLGSVFKKYRKKRELFSIETNEQYDNYKLITKLEDDKKRIIPVFHVSSVSGFNIELLRNFVLDLKPIIPYDNYLNEDSHFVVDSRFLLKGIGLVVSGVVKSGIVRKNDTLFIGPINGGFKKISIKSIHNNFREDVDSLEAGHGGSLNIKLQNSKDILKRGMIRKGIHILKTPKMFTKFEADILILHHPTTIKLHYQPYIHCGNVSQCSEIYEMDKDCLRIGEKAHVKFKFLYKPEYILEGTKIIFREGRSKGVGIITKILE